MTYKLFALVLVLSVSLQAIAGSLYGPVNEGFTGSTYEGTSRAVERSDSGYYVTFRGGEIATVVLAASYPNQDASVEIYDLSGNLIAKDTSISSTPGAEIAFISFVPRTTAKYEIRLIADHGWSWRTN